jgi:4-amino-4-deoxy-L-arabinose transferase-like glycosyltransferase
MNASSLKPATRWLILVVIFAFALAVRAYKIGDYPLESHPVKQFRSAFTARNYYYQFTNLIPEWKKDVASANVEEMGSLGPTIMEHIAAVAYFLAGGEQLWIPRLLSAASWVIGGIFLYLLAQQLASTKAAIISTSFYLFLPFGIRISRNFQPDPLMIMMMIISLFAVVHYYNRPSRKWLLIASGATALAIYIKPVSLFVVYAGFIALALTRQSLRQAIVNLDNILFFVASLLPTGLYYGSDILFAGDLQGQAQASFLPALLVEPYYWQFWLKHIYAVVGFAALLGALLGVLLFSKGWKRNFVIGLWIGYLVYGLVFTYHIHTHDYYQMPLIPIVALSLGPLGALILDQLLKLYPSRFSRLVIGAIFALAILLHIGLYARWREELPDFTAEVLLGEEIGNTVNHSTSSVILAPYAGRPYRYYGQFSGKTWPTRADINAERLVGEPEITVEKRLQMLNSDGRADYFIIADMQEFDRQTDLKDYLHDEFIVMASSNDYIIFDLRNTATPGN